MKDYEERTKGKKEKEKGERGGGLDGVVGVQRNIKGTRIT